MKELTPQEHFDTLLKKYKAFESPGYQTNPHGWALMVLESGIFHKGGLSALQNGRNLTGGKSHYPIEDLEGFVDELGRLLDIWLIKFGVNGFQNETKQRWKCLEDDLDYIAGGLIASKIAKRKEIDNIRGKFEQWRELTGIQLSLDERFKLANSILKKEALKIFSEHLPGVPQVTITKRCAELLIKIGIAIKNETLRKRLYRSRTKTPTK